LTISGRRSTRPACWRRRPGVSIEETTGTLAAFASAGLIGSDAGTSFKTMLQQLQNPSQESAELMQQLGINAYDAQGNFVGLADLAQQLKSTWAI
jgi:TP901 family phage tail tape measure protein